MEAYQLNQGKFGTLFSSVGVSNMIVDGRMVVTSEITIGECICMIMKEMKGLQFVVCSDSYVVMELVLQVVRNVCVAEYFS